MRTNIPCIKIVLLKCKKPAAGNLPLIKQFYELF